jgi:hypothetical protein
MALARRLREAKFLSPGDMETNPDPSRQATVPGARQFAFVMPKIDTVVMTTGSNYAIDYSQVFELINAYVLGSICGNS